MTTIPTPAPPADQEVAAAAEALAGRVLEAGVAALELLTIAMGDELGLYRAVRESGSTPAPDLARRLGLDERYVTEWCDQQAIAGLLTATGTSRRYALAPGVAEVLVEPTSPTYSAPVARLPQCVVTVLPRLLDGFRTGAGVPYADYGPDAVQAQGALNRHDFEHALATEWVPAIEGLEQRLRDGSRPAVVADIGCGVGWAAVALARAYPAVTVHGYDSDPASIEQARRNAAEAGVAGRVRFTEADGLDPADRVDVAFFFECLHDMAHPTDVLRQLHAQLAPDGTVVVADERAAEEFTAPGDLVERFLASCSVLWCLPQSRTDERSEALGTLLRPATVRRLAADAGYRGTEVLPVEHPFWRFYRLVP
jgi:SAM-dependent methyltransferase